MAVRKLDKFPTVFERLTRKALAAMATTRVDGPPLLRIPCPTRGAAVNLQMQIRQYWQALDEAHQSGTSGLYAGIGDIAPRAAVLAIRYDKVDKRVLEVIHRNQTRGAGIIANALAMIDQSLDELDRADPEAKPTGAPSAPRAGDSMNDLIERELLGASDAADAANPPRK